MQGAPETRPTKPTVTAVVFSLNEADLLRDCLPCLVGFDDVLVCDMGSEDDTALVAEHFSARRLEVPRVPVIEQVRQLALDDVSTDWVLFVDADERLPEGYRDAIDGAIRADPHVAAFRLRYDDFAFGHRLAHPAAGTAKYALVRRAAVTYRSDLGAHEPPDFLGPLVDAPPSVPPIVHLNFRTIDQTLEKAMRYAMLRPRNDPPRPTSPWDLVRELLRATIFNGQWRDGRPGVTVASTQAFAEYYAQARFWEAENYDDPGWTKPQRVLLAVVERLQRLLVSIRNVLRRR